MDINRRKFLSKGSKLAGASIITPSLFPAIITGKNKANYKAAIIGHTGKGDYGHGLDRIFNDLAKVTVVAVADENPEGLDEAVQNSGAKRSYTSYEKMLTKEKPDLVSIAPRQPFEHRAMALAAIDIGAHIYMEKPFTAYPEEADDILKAAKQKGCKIGVAHHRRYYQSFHALRDHIREGLIGTVLEMRYYGKMDSRVGGEDMMVLGTHDFDTMRFLFGDPEWCHASVTVNGQGISTEDVRQGREPYQVAGRTVRATYAFPDNIHCYWTSVQTNDQWNTDEADISGSEKWGFDILGTEGNIFYRNALGFHYLPSHHIAPQKEETWQKLPSIDKNYPAHLLHPIKSLIHAIEANGQPACNGNDGRWAVEMVMGPYWSELAGERIAFPLEKRGHPLESFRSE